METVSEKRYGWLWGLLLVFLGVVFLLNQTIGLVVSELIWAIMMAGIAVTFLAVYIASGRQTWALIPAYVFGAIAGLILLSMVSVGVGLSGDLIAVYVLSAIALPFLVVYLLNRENWWALIPAYVMGAIIGILVIEDLWFVRRNPGDIVGAYVMFAIALPFFYVYLRNRENWWALIPGGIMLTIGVGLLAGAFEIIIPVALVIAGLFLLTRQFVRGGSRPAITEHIETPRYGPEADRAPDTFESLGTRQTGPEADHE